MKDCEPQKLISMYRRAKTKMIVGIVLTIIAFLILSFGLFCATYLDLLLIILAVPALPILAVGLPMLIIEAKWATKLNRRINAIKADKNDL